jgi:hypothetical protein
MKYILSIEFAALASFCYYYILPFYRFLQEQETILYVVLTIHTMLFEVSYILFCRYLGIIYH